MKEIESTCKKESFYFDHPDDKDMHLRLDYTKNGDWFLYQLYDDSYIDTNIKVLSANIKINDHTNNSIDEDCQYYGFSFSQIYPYPFVLLYNRERVVFV